jgi:hypothetical protein
VGKANSRANCGRTKIGRRNCLQASTSYGISFQGSDVRIVLPSDPVVNCTRHIVRYNMGTSVFLTIELGILVVGDV